jgi:transposase-like protein
MSTSELSNPHTPRQHRSMEERRRIVELTFREGASISEIARANDVHPTSLSHWRTLYRSGKLTTDAPRQDTPSTTSSMTFLPVKLAPGQAVVSPPSQMAVRSAMNASTHKPDVVQIMFPSGATLRMETSAIDAAFICALLAEVRG